MTAPRMTAPRTGFGRWTTARRTGFGRWTTTPWIFSRTGASRQSAARGIPWPGPALGRVGQGCSEFVEGVHGVRADHGVAVRPGCGHAPGQRLILRALGPRVYPDDAMSHPGKPLHLRAEQRRIAGVPPVGDDDDNRAAGQPGAPAGVVEFLDRTTAAGAAQPVGRSLAGPPQGEFRAGMRERGGEPGQPGGKGEYLRPRTARGAVQQLQQDRKSVA